MSSEQRPKTGITLNDIFFFIYHRGRIIEMPDHSEFFHRQRRKSTVSSQRVRTFITVKQTWSILTMEMGSVLLRALCGTPV